MKKYLGSPIDAFASLITPLFILLPLYFAISSLSTGIDAARIMLLIGCIMCAAIWIAYLKQIGPQLYSWGLFSETSVQVKTLFTKPYYLIYTKCRGCGIGYYTHGILNSQAGSKIFYIFLSYDNFDEQYRTRINLWKPTTARMKVRFSKEVYDFLITVLPKARAQTLEQDYRQYVHKGGYRVMR